MKRTFLLSLFGVMLFLYSCSSNVPTEPQDTQQGGISLTIDRVHKPDNVVSVSAYLSRENFDTLSGSLNLLSDTTADITFNDIAAGNWYLKVDAADEQNTVVYTGEADVNILAGVTTQVYLTLEPTGAGYGNIYIYVNWGVPANTSWIDYEHNPMILPSIIPDTPIALFHPKVVYDDGIYKMWFTSVYGSAVSNVWYAVSNDGKNWELGHNGPVLDYGTENEWDSHAVESGPVIKDENGYKMYYLGFADEYGSWNIGLATSPDGINWAKYPTPVIYADPMEYQVIPDDIIKIENTYYLYYTIRQYPYYKIGLATSTDGINFTKTYPILMATYSWEGTGVQSPSVIFENGQFKMVYSVYPGVGFGTAVSNDGIDWTKDNNNPFFRFNDVHNDWCSKIAYPFWRKYNGQYRIYYTGSIDGYNTAGIGMIYK